MSREADTFTLTFAFHRDLVTAAKTLPYATFDRETKTWTTPVCEQSVNTLRTWDHQGWTTRTVDSLLQPGETPAPVASATLRAGGTKRPYTVTVAGGDDTVYTRLRAIPGAAWDKPSQSLTYPVAAGAALVDLIASGLLADPDNVFGTNDATIAYDPRVGRCVVLGNEAANSVFQQHFPHTDAVATWKERGLDVGFLNELSDTMYHGELIRVQGAPQPDGLNVTLYPFQRVNAAIAALRDGHAIFDEPGLGKTISGIAAGMWRLADNATRIVVVAPAAVRTGWANEITRATGHTDITVVAGTGKQRQAAVDQALAAGHRWVICHYDILARDKKMLAPLFAGAYIIADEAHRVKSPEAARTKALRSLSTAAVGRLGLTGTPVETSPGEWFDILSGWVLPGILGTPIDFNERYRWKNTWGGYEGARNVTELRNRSKYLYTRHTKSEVASHLPPLQVQQQQLDPDATYAAALRRAHTDAADEIRQEAQKRVQAQTAARTGQDVLVDEQAHTAAQDGADMTAVGFLRLLCSSPRLVLESESSAAAALKDAGLIPDIDGPKVDYLRNVAAGLKTTYERRMATAEPGVVPTVADVMNERMVVFTFSERMARLLSQRFTEDGVPNVLFTGAVSHQDRDAAVASFTDPTTDTLVFISTDAGAEGLNLGKCCSLLINADLAWTASKMAQRAQRIHRIDSTASRYHVINLTLTGTLEAGIVKMLESRADLTDALLGEHGSRSRTTGRRARPGDHGLLTEALATMAVQDIGSRPVPKRRKRNPGEQPSAVSSASPPGDEDGQLTLLESA